MSQYKVILLLGTNLGDRKKNILTAIDHIKKSLGEITDFSEILETEPSEFCSFNNFLNFAIGLNTSSSPIQLLKSIKKIEQDMGRKEDTTIVGEYKDRIIDIDIVQYEGLVFWCNTLSIPHLKHTQERDFSKQLINEILKKHKV